MPDGLRDVDLSLVDSLMVPASLHDVDGRFVHVNAAAERASGMSNAQLLGHHFTEPLAPKEREKVTAQFRRAVEHGVPTDFDLLASGLFTSEIARKLTLSTETVRNHLRSVFRELYVHTRPEAIAAARRLGLLAPTALGPQASDPGADTGVMLPAAHT
jgi:hypothetical protein